MVGWLVAVYLFMLQERPATADADPGYHTGLSIIHVITALDARAAVSKL